MTEGDEETPEAELPKAEKFSELPELSSRAPWLPPDPGGSLNFEHEQSPYGSFISRLGGYILDFLIMLASLWVFALIAYLAHAPAVGNLGIFIFFLYPWLMIAKADGQTVGMKVVKVHCIDVRTGGPPTMTQAAGRTVAWLIFTLFSFFLAWIPLSVDLLWPAWDKKSQTLHDKMARTVVIRLDRL